MFSDMLESWRPHLDNGRDREELASSAISKKIISTREEKGVGHVVKTQNKWRILSGAGLSG